MPIQKQLIPSVPNEIGSIYAPNNNDWRDNMILVGLVERMKKINKRYNKNKDVISKELYNDLFSKFLTVNSNLQALKLDDTYNNEGLLTHIESKLDDIENENTSNIGGRRNKPAYDKMTMEDVKELCKANQIKLSRVVNDKRVVYKKKELITKLKRKKVI